MIQTKPKITTLPNGLKIGTIELPESPTTTVQVFVNTGSLYEKPTENGVAHFLEHLCFKGTTQRTGREIANTLDGIGAENNAFTSHEYTSYYAKSASKHVDTLLGIISDLYLHPTLPESDIETERGVVLGEIDMYEDTPRAESPYILNELLFADQPAGRRILGPKSIIQNITRSEIEQFRNYWYQAPNTLFLVAGPHTHTEMLKKAQKLFTDIPEKQTKPRPKVRIGTSKSSIRIKQKNCDQAHLIVGFPTFAANHVDQPILDVLIALLGIGMSSRLFTRIREQMGAGYYIRADQEQFREIGYLGIMAGTEPCRVSEVVSAILDECKKIYTTEIPTNELTKAQEVITGKTVMGFESSEAHTNYYGALHSLGQEFETPAQYLKKIRSVTVPQIQKLAKKLFTKRNTYIGVIGNKISEKKVQESIDLVL